MSASRTEDRKLLLRVARRAMFERGLEPDLPPAALAEAGALKGPAGADGPEVQDLRGLLWCSIDNDDSRDLDQLTVAEPLAGDGARVRVAVADVSAVVHPGSAVDGHAAANTTSVYTAPRNFPMLPERLSTDLTSLNPNQDRLALVAEMVVDGAGRVTSSSVGRALVRNRAQLAYPSVGAWLEGEGDAPEPVRSVAGLDETLRLQDRVARRLRALRHERGALELETIDVRARFDGERVSELTAERRNPARDLIEDFMIAANGAIAGILEARGFPVVRRVVRAPERWQRIVALAGGLNESLPAEPDARALHDFLVRRRMADPLRFPDLSLAIIKLLGKGEYVASLPGQATAGHFGLAVSDYTHSTAPNRRYPDLITQRLLRAALAGREPPYPAARLEALADHCTKKEDDAQKVERLVRKAAAACLLSDRLGERFDGIVTGASPKGTWVRVFDPPVEGRLEEGWEGLDVGDQVRVKLVRADPERGYIDFVHSANRGPQRV